MPSKQIFMRKVREIVDAALVCFCLILWLGANARPAHAYADPGTGLMAIQILGSTLAGFLFLIRRRVFDLFARIRRMTGKRRD
jgi:FtsH-binding integral membrane protein